MVPAFLAKVIVEVKILILMEKIVSLVPSLLYFGMDLHALHALKINTLLNPILVLRALTLNIGMEALVEQVKGI